jgi:hypothetical protein
MGGASSRRKGQTGEREVCKLIRDALDIDASRNLDQTREGGSDIMSIPGYALEVKKHAAVSQGKISKWWEQAVRQAIECGRTPVLFYRIPSSTWRVVLAMDAVVDQSDYLMTVTISPELFFEMIRESVSPESSAFEPLRKDDFGM